MNWVERESVASISQNTSNFIWSTSPPIDTKYINLILDLKFNILMMILHVPKLFSKMHKILKLFHCYIRVLEKNFKIFRF